MVMVLLSAAAAIDGGKAVFGSAARLKSKEILRDSLTITKNPGNLFGLGSNKIAKSDQNSRLHSHHSNASRRFETSEEQGHLLADRGSTILFLHRSIILIDVTP